MFFFHTLRPMNMEEEVNILEALVGDKLALAMHPVLKLAQHVRQSNDPTLNSLAPSLSTRQLLRLAKRLKVRALKEEDLERKIDKILSKLGIPK